MLALIKTMCEGDEEDLRNFLSEISPPSIQRSELDMAFLYAVQDGFTQKVKDFIADGANINTYDDLGNTALHIAVELNFVGIVELLLKAGADSSLQNDFDQTPFELAQETFLRYQEILNLFSAKS